jgi:hypothetical protein
VICGFNLSAGLNNETISDISFLSSSDTFSKFRVIDEVSHILTGIKFQIFTDSYNLGPIVRTTKSLGSNNSSKYGTIPWLPLYHGHHNNASGHFRRATTNELILFPIPLSEIE